jgi:hypothetical protein
LTARRRYATGAAAGGALALALFAFLLLSTGEGLLHREILGGFYDTQADALLHGHWNVASAPLFIEAFIIKGKAYEYFGVWPALLRMPVALFTDRFAGRLTAPSMLLAAAVAIAGLGCLSWRIRTIVRPDSECGPWEAVLAGALVFGITAGSSFVFLASRAWGYHEAIIWGVAWSYVAYERILAYLQAPAPRRIAMASAATTLAFLSRVSIGAGPVATLGLVFVVALWQRLRARTANRSHASNQTQAAGPTGRSWGVVACGIAVAVPVVLYAWVNYSRFGSVWSTPWTKQVVYSVDATRRHVLNANHGTYIGAKFIPTTAFQYLRPDAIAFTKLFPFVTFPRFSLHVFGNAVFDKLEPSSSLTASMPALFVLALVGGAGALFPRWTRSDGTTLLRVPLLGATVGFVFTLAISYTAQRYLNDFLPFVVLAALLGVQVLASRWTTPGRKGLRAAAVVALAALAVFSVWANVGLTLDKQRLTDPAAPATRVSMVGTQYDIAHALGMGLPDAHFGARLPARPMRSGSTFVVGACDTMYWSTGSAWIALQGTNAGGWFTIDARLAPSLTWQPLVSWGSGARQAAVALRRERDRIVLSVIQRGPTGTRVHRAFASVPYLGGRRQRVALQIDLPLGNVRASIDGASVFDEPVAGMPDGAFHLGIARIPGVATSFDRTLRNVPVHPRVCETILRRHVGS